MTKRTLRGTNLKKVRVSGFRSRMASKTGRRIINSRMHPFYGISPETYYEFGITKYSLEECAERVRSRGYVYFAYHSGDHHRKCWGYKNEHVPPLQLNFISRSIRE